MGENMSFHTLLANKALCKIRTITTFITLEEDKRTWPHALEKANTFCHALAADFQKKGYTVQSIRIVTNAFGEYINTHSLQTAQQDLRLLRRSLTALQSVDSSLRLRVAIGEATNAHELSLVPELIKEFGDLCNVCVNIPQDTGGFLDNHFIEAAATTVKKISEITPRGEGNFNFTVNFNCQPLIPYFPASYFNKQSKNAFVIGLETPDLLVATLKAINESMSDSDPHQLFSTYYQSLSNNLQHHVDQIKEIVTAPSLGSHFEFAGLDSSAAPSKHCASMTELYELMGVSHFGASGTVAVSELLTRVFKSVSGMPLVGFSGLMLALTEDKGLAAGSEQDHFDIRTLLTNSAVCGIGLDTVPIPGDTSVSKIMALMRDTGTMAFKLNKPLTVRLFPVPNLKAGERTQFESDDLCNCHVLAVH